MNTAIAIITALVSGAPKLADLIKRGVDPATIKLGDFISLDALKKLEDAKDEAEDFITNG